MTASPSNLSWINSPSQGMRKPQAPIFFKKMLPRAWKQLGKEKEKKITTWLAGNVEQRGVSLSRPIDFVQVFNPEPVFSSNLIILVCSKHIVALPCCELPPHGRPQPVAEHEPDPVLALLWNLLRRQEVVAHLADVLNGRKK